MDQIPINFGDDNYKPLFAYKHGLQNFPNSTTSEKLLPYAAVTSVDGNKIILTLSDSITDLNYEYGNISIFVNDTDLSQLFNNISISNFDKSILQIDLNTPVEETDKIELSYSGTSIVSSNLVLENFTNLYVHNIVNSNVAAKEIPGKIEAEDYFEMFGIQTESCSDNGGGFNVGYIDSGDWLKYSIEAKSSGLYNITARTSGYSNGSLILTFNDTLQTQVNYTSTNGWQNWNDFTSEVYLNAGNYTMKTLAQTDALNINYFDFGLTNSLIKNEVSIQEINVFPNPVNSILNIEFSSYYSNNVSIKLINISGKVSQILHQGQLYKGVNSYKFSLDSNTPTGIYFIEIKDDHKRYFKKILIK